MKEEDGKLDGLVDLPDVELGRIAGRNVYVNCWSLLWLQGQV